MLYTIELIRFIPGRVGVLGQITHVDNDPEAAKEKAKRFLMETKVANVTRVRLLTGRRRGFQLGARSLKPCANLLRAHIRCHGTLPLKADAHSPRVQGRVGMVRRGNMERLPPRTDRRVPVRLRGSRLDQPEIDRLFQGAAAVT